MMKKSILYILIAAIMLVACACGGNDGGTPASQPASQEASQPAEIPLQTYLDKGKLVIGLDDNFPPAGFRDEQGNLVGFDIDLATAVCEKLGVEPEFKAVEWSGVLMTLNNGDIDLIWNACTITEERLEQISFSRIYAAAGNVMIVQPGSDIKEKADLAGKTLGVQLTSSGQEKVEADPISSELKELRKYGTYTEAFMDLQAGRIDCVVTDMLNAGYYISLEQLADKLVILEPREFGIDEFGVGVRNQDVALKDAINEAMEELIADGTMDEINKKWFGDEQIMR